MMMTSTFPTSRNNSRNIKNGLKEIQTKKDCLITLETALKKRINEFRELCLKEGELTGHLPADYPLQPREPIPQVRRRVTRSSGNISDEFAGMSSIMPPPSTQQRLIQRPHNQTTTMTLPSTISQPPSRPTSNSSSSTSSSYRHPSGVPSIQFGRGPASHNNNNLCNSTTAIKQNQMQQYHAMRQSCTTNALPTHFKKPYNLTTNDPNFDMDSLGHMRASSTASSSSSSGSAASSTASAFASIPGNNYRLNDLLSSNMHGRSYSENVNSRQCSMSTSRPMPNTSSQSSVQRQGSQPDYNNIQRIASHHSSSQQPIRPPRGLNSNIASDCATKSTATQINNKHLTVKQTSEGNINGLSVNGSPIIKRPNAVSAKEEPPKLSDLTNGVAQFQPYYEETKPFQMSDFYKYSAKHRHRSEPDGAQTLLNSQVKTTRQLQEDVSRAKSSLRYAACDDQIQQSVKLIEKSGQKLIEATAKAIAGNPSLAERLHNILPSHQHH